jgi:hypothetical protein
VQLEPARVLRRRARRGHLDRSGGSVADVARAVAALHGTDPATIHLSVHARQPLRPLAGLAAELREVMEGTRALVRLLGMRRTIHVVDTALAPAVLALARLRLDPERQKQAGRFLAQAGAPGLDGLRGAVLAALDAGDLDTDVLTERIPALALRVGLAEGKAYAGDAAVARFVLEALGTEGSLVRGRVLGGWRSNRTTWARMEGWLPGLGALPSGAEAYAALARVWLGAFGPGTLEDLAWWAGIPKGDAKAALAALGRGVVRVSVTGWRGERFALAGDTLEDEGPPAGPALLPALDPAGMCWTERGPFLDPALAGPLFDRSGNIGPTVWVDGRIVGGWACRRDGSIAVRVLAAGVDEDAVRAEATRVEQALGGEVVRPRFPTPLVKEIWG